MIGVISLFALASAAGADDFDRAWAEAEEVSRLEAFLDETVGDCEKVPNKDGARRACEREAQSVRRERSGKVFAVRFDDLASRLSDFGFDRKKKQYRVLLTPVFGAGGLGLTLGAPLRLDGAGHPIVRRLPVWLTKPSDVPEPFFRRDVERGLLRMELLFEVERAWRMQRAGHVVRGLSVRLRGLRLRTRSDVIAETLSPP